MTDIVKRLRNEPDSPCSLDTIYAAADEIERLREKYADAKEQLIIKRNHIENLNEQLAACQQDRDDHLRSWNRVVDENVKLRDELASCQKDAERYRWLRVQHADMKKQIVYAGGTYFDSVIDAAMGEK